MADITTSYDYNPFNAINDFLMPNIVYIVAIIGIYCLYKVIWRAFKW